MRFNFCNCSRDEKEVSDCLMQYIDNTCSADSLFQQLVNDTFNFDQPSCKGNSRITIANITLITVALLTIFKLL